MLLLEKQCIKCGQIVSARQFTKNKAKKDGLGSYCLECNGIARSEWGKNNPDKLKAQKQRRNQQDRVKQSNREFYQSNREAILAKLKRQRTGKEGYLKVMLRSAKSRAKENNLEFDIDLQYLQSVVTDYCPIDGLPFDWERHLATDKSLPLATPSLDRIDSSKGYVKGNVKIIGWKWNAKKSNMNLDDLLLLVKYVRNAAKLKKVDDF
jgi:hypothetical protein